MYAVSTKLVCLAGVYGSWDFTLTPFSLCYNKRYGRVWQAGIFFLMLSKQDKKRESLGFRKASVELDVQVSVLSGTRKKGFLWLKSFLERPTYWIFRG